MSYFMVFFAIENCPGNYTYGHGAFDVNEVFFGNNQVASAFKKRLGFSQESKFILTGFQRLTKDEYDYFVNN